MKLTALIVLTVTIIGATTFIICRDKPPISQQVPLQVSVASVVYSEETQRAFWDEFLKPTIMDELLAGKYHIPELRERFQFLNAEVAKRYGKLTIVCIKNYATVGKHVAEGNWIDRGTAKLEIMIPAHMDICHELRSSGKPDWREQFEINAVLGVLHEMEHLAGDRSDLDPQTRESLVTIEKQAWARTCRYDIAPLAEKYDIHIPEGSLSYYRNWLASGQDEDSPVWHQWINSIYGPLRE